MEWFQDGSSWDLPGFSSYIMEDITPSSDFYSSIDNNNNQSGSMELDAAAPLDVAPQEKGCAHRRLRSESCSIPGSKSCRDKARRDKMNERFEELSCTLDPGRPPKTDKCAILTDAIHVVKQQRIESQGLKDEIKKLQEDLRNVKEQKNELREEKIQLKADKERLEQQMRAMTVVPPGFVPPPTPPPPHSAACYHAPGVNKMVAFPSSGGPGFPPMWHWIPPTTLDTSNDQVLRPPAA